jgi:hypothetical protein
MREEGEEVSRREKVVPVKAEVSPAGEVDCLAYFLLTCLPSFGA